VQHVADVAAATPAALLRQQNAHQLVAMVVADHLDQPQQVLLARAALNSGKPSLRYVTQGCGAPSFLLPQGGAGPMALMLLGSLMMMMMMMTQVVSQASLGLSE
jgi:hypothetical protein